jgi:hypothetical protein
MKVEPAARKNPASGAPTSLEQMVGFFSSAKDWLGAHRIEVYDPVVRTISTLVRSLFMVAGGVVGGFVLARIFPDFLNIRPPAKKLKSRRINVSGEIETNSNFNSSSTFSHYT